MVQGLDYTTPENAVHAETLSNEMEDVAKMALGSVPDIWHIHNHSLGKNPALPLALSKLAQKGARMLLHPHDFAEDGRPGNYKALSESYQFLYPSSSGIHYAARTHRDLSYLQKMLEDSPSKAHLLANAIPDYDDGVNATVGSSARLAEVPDQMTRLVVRQFHNRRNQVAEQMHLATSAAPCFDSTPSRARSRDAIQSSAAGDA